MHAPGQLAIYPVLPLDRLGLGLNEYLSRLADVLIDVLRTFSVAAHREQGSPAVWVSSRPIAGIGVAVRDWVSYFGACLNINPDLELFRVVHWEKPAGAIMTSLERERHAPLRPSLVRERLIESFAEHFGFDQTYFFSEHPLLRRKASRNALATSS